ncbi:hypothetical protein MJO28_000993 [Puccinia striiformis f. sp. tritici]|uniref:Secreted protein n=3 Tax=Puccinia striiformis TaxID=27350 RepID=A0A0L0VRH9_9BASI|nr:hypothetical protein Pst134EB_001482 [Puccinia striiformis f. sp. tritici]KAI9601496.1 hypothetical protein H4Q26_001316 [Puccinia striiformis f. sp. tritici PST-130]KNF01888.1 hypothetical protein PSTG_05005 [Puccinia striiformis f. sp. tritici PST-78]POW17396.1 hypothetical protein PSTT_00683 [Puccinia striiformis]KAI7962899.1 hypothetical protein MJO28_000993 [Puccinia striiformis f. sp. tritici]
MFTYQFVIIAAVSQLAGNSLAIDCYPNTDVNKADCHAAVDKIVYNKDNRLDTTSKYFDYNSKNCSINLTNPKGASPTKEQVWAAYDMILNQCVTKAGGGDLDTASSIHLNIGNSGTGPYKPYNSDFPYLTESCGLNTNAHDIVKEDCMKAYHSIPMSVEGTFLDENNQEAPSIEKTVGTCTLIFYASDGSKMNATNGQIRPIFEKLVNKCDKQSGVVSVKGGVEGQNGRVYLKIRSSRSCKVQVCY